MLSIRKIKIEGKRSPREKPNTSTKQATKYSMTHRYNTRFQAKIQEEQRRVESEAALEKTVEYSRSLMDQIDAVQTFTEKLELLILLYQHFYDESLLLTHYERFRTATWKKMNDQETTLLTKLQTRPAKLGQTTESWRERGLMIQLLDQMEWVRAKYW